MKKCFITFVFLITHFSCFATPDRERTITDILLGFTNNKIIIYQVISDNHGSHYNGIYERFILIKGIQNHKLTLLEKHRITKDSEITSLINEPSFVYAVPDICQSKYLSIHVNNSITYLGTSYNLKDILPKELQEYRLDSIDQIYDLTDNVLVVINLVNKNNTEFLKKVILLLERNK